MNKYDEIVYLMQHIGKDPSRLIFEDELTGIYNRRFLHNYFTHKVAWDTLSSHPVALIMMDVDHFKQINDTYGHQVGDQTLIWVAELLKEAAGDTNIPIRYAGDEFLIFLPGADRRAASALGQQLLQFVHERSFRSETLDTPLTLTLSIGIVW
jgi:diguanylate cyclase (GGDEF)-like protein